MENIHICDKQTSRQYFHANFKLRPKIEQAIKPASKHFLVKFDLVPHVRVNIFSENNSYLKKNSSKNIQTSSFQLTPANSIFFEF